MKEKTKQILRYVACGLGGVALGIGLLGGLSMCATSNNKTTESVNTILAKTPKGEQITTTDGGYTGYSFTVQEEWSTTENIMNWRVYDVDTSTYTLTSLSSGAVTNLNSWGTIRAGVNAIYSNYKPSANNLRFLASWTLSNWGSGGIYFAYFTFILPNGQTSAYPPKAFLKTNWETSYAIRLDQDAYAWSEDNYNSYYITYEQSNVMLHERNVMSYRPVTNVSFQDVESYYKNQGYSDGYTDGNSAGYSEGYEDGNQEGYDNGYQDGNQHGQGQGYDDGYNEGLTDGLEYGQEFTTYQIMTQSNNGGTYWPSYGWDINNNAPAGMYGNFDSSTYQIANLLQYKTEDNDLHLIYLMLRIESADDNQYFSHAYIYQYNQTDATLEDTVANGLMYYQAAADRYGWDYAHIYWTSGGTRNIDYGKVTGIYNDSLRKGYIQLSGQITDQNVYDTGYQAGLLAGQQNSNMNNVFSLFTGAFDACASFFNLRIFGFLPLYWFFLAPLFIALITLLLRMVKH